MPPDIVTLAVRRRMMQAVPRTATSTERTVRAALTRIGVRRGWTSKRLPGTPDIVNMSHRWVIFVHGCFWHGHAHCRKTKGGASGRIPTSNTAFWTTKITANRERDSRKARELRRAGFRVLTVWECETLVPDQLDRRLKRFFATPNGPQPRRGGVNG